MSKYHRSALFLLTAAVLVLAACGPAPTPQTVEKVVEITQIVEGETVVITATPDMSAMEPTQLPPGSVEIYGSGATFPLAVYTEWVYAYQYVDPSVVVNYSGIGSGGGQKAIIAREVDFAGSDSLLNDDQYTEGGDLQMLPMVAGPIVMIYNIDGINPQAAENPDPALILDGKTLVGIYNGSINKWNDPAIVALNPDLAAKLPDATIYVAHRADSSGTTEAFTKSLALFDSAGWPGELVGKSPEWPVDKAGTGLGGSKNAGVASIVQNTPNSIGYVELSYAMENSIAFSKMVNAAGNTVEANMESLQAAMIGNFNDRFNLDIMNSPEENAWPMATYTYLIVRMNSMDDCLKAQKLVEFITWSLTDSGAGERAAKLGFAVLPPQVRDQVLAKLGEMTCQGNPVMVK